MEFQKIILYILGFLSSLLLGAYGWIFQALFKKINTVESDLGKLSEKHQSHKSEVNNKFSEIKQEIALNAQKDQSNQKEMMLKLDMLSKQLTIQQEQMDKWQKNIENFYHSNPELVKPDNPHSHK